MKVFPGASPFAAVVTAAVLLGGCGGSGGQRSSAAPPSFKTALIERMAPMRAVGGQLTSALQQAPAQSDAQVRTTFSQLAQLTRPVEQGLAGLHPPARYAGDVQTMRVALARAAADLQAVARAAARHQAGAKRAAFAKLTADSGVVKAADQRLSIALGFGTG